VNPEASNDGELDKLLAELEKKPEEADIPKKDDKNPYKDKKNDDYNTYEYSDDKDLSDEDW